VRGLPEHTRRRPDAISCARLCSLILLLLLVFARLAKLHTISVTLLTHTVASCHPNTTQLAHQHKLHKRSSSTGTTVKFITQNITLNPGSNSTDKHTPATAHHCNCCTAAARASSLVVHAFSLQYITVQYITVQYITVHYSTVQYSTVQYSTAQV
jgi:hypothetical protein